MPFLRLGKRLSGHGHRVYFYGESHFAKLAEDHQVVFSGALDLNVDQKRFYHKGIMGVLLDQAILSAMAERIDRTFNRADLILAHPLVTAFYPLARARNWPFLTLFTAPAFMPSIHNPPFDPKYRVASILASMSPHVARLLLVLANKERKARTLSYLDFAASVGDTSGLSWSDSVFSDILNIGWFLPELLPSRKGLPNRPFIFGFNPFGDEEKISDKAKVFLAEEKDFILVGMGSNPLPKIKETTTRTFIAAEKLGVRVAVLGATHFEHIRLAFPDVHSAFFEMEPMTPFLQKAKLAVHHGGAGITSECAMFGVPSVIIPLAFDQFKNAHMAKKLGIACKTSPEEAERCIIQTWGKKIKTIYRIDEANRFISELIDRIERFSQLPRPEGQDVA
jgi:rhamnosyltransferase subunit B